MLLRQLHSELGYSSRARAIAMGNRLWRSHPLLPEPQMRIHQPTPPFYTQAFDVATSTIVNTANTSRGINSVSTWDLDGPHATTALVMSYYGSTPMQLLAMDWLTGKTTKLMELKDETYSGDPSVQVSDGGDAEGEGGGVGA